VACVIVVGAQWGDEGKGEVLDVFTELADVVVRYEGAARAGDATRTDGEGSTPLVIPVAALRKKKRAVLGPGVIIDPKELVREVKDAQSKGSCADAQDLVVSDAAHLVLPYHHAIDEARAAKGQRPPPWGMGVRPACEDKVAGLGVRVADLFRPSALRFKLTRNVRAKNEQLAREGHPELALQEIIDAVESYAEVLKPFVMNVPRLLDELRRRGKNILLEGQQGALLDVDHGAYPFVAPTSTVAGGAIGGAGIGPTHVGAVVGVAKAYTTHVGEGPFPTEDRELGPLLAQSGVEAPMEGAATRRCGWLDLVALRHAARVAGLTGLALTRLDALRGLAKVKVCVAYDLDGERIDELPPDAGELERCEPIYEELDGWSDDLSGARSLDNLPRTTRAYLSRISGLLGLPVIMVSVGAQRSETISVQNPFR